MEEGTIVRWLVKEGDRVKIGDVLYELETDKATIEVTAEEPGRIAKIVVADGQTAPVKSPVAYLSEGEVQAPAIGTQPVEPAAAAPATPQAVAPRATPDTVPTPDDTLAPSRKRASPLARNAARELGIDIETLSAGSGPDGRILLEDVQRAADHPAVKQPSPVAATAMPGGTRRAMSKMRRAIARNLALSKQTVPHFYLKLTVDAQPLLAFHKKEKALYPCSVTDVLIEACGRAIQEFPEFRSQVEGDEVVQFDHVNIGLAVALDDGLVVPVVRNVDSLNLKGIAAETRRLIDLARQGKPEFMGEGMFTISNMGMLGVDEFSAIINPPESAILAVGAVREEVVVKDGAMRAGKRMTLTLSCDHRIVDGALAAKFAARLKELLESPGL
jgi:pyruvate dehydrogenase E2 component (dihydrolipoamide acetyltransferase)